MTDSKTNNYRAVTVNVGTTPTKLVDQSTYRKRIIIYNKSATQTLLLSLYDDGSHPIIVDPGKMLTFTENAPLNAMYGKFASSAEYVSIWYA